jgi:hypothetical protein
MNKRTLGEILIAALLGLVAAILTAVAAFVAAIFACAYLFPSAASNPSVVCGPVAALFCGAFAFALTFRWILHYGDHPSSRE